jgi:hypothetical protein
MFSGMTILKANNIETTNHQLQLVPGIVKIIYINSLNEKLQKIYLITYL